MNFWNAFCYPESDFYGGQRQAAQRAHRRV